VNLIYQEVLFIRRRQEATPFKLHFLFPDAGVELCLSGHWTGLVSHEISSAASTFSQAASSCKVEYFFGHGA
jgi:hypothetical protein